MFFRFVCPMHLQINITMPASDTLSDILMVSRSLWLCEKYHARAAAIHMANNNNSSNQQ